MSWHNEIAQMALNNNHSLRYELIQLYFCLYWHIFIQLITFLLWFLLVIYFLYSRTQFNFMFMQQYFKFIGNIYLSVRWSLPTWWSSKKSCNQFCVSLRNVNVNLITCLMLCFLSPFLPFYFDCNTSYPKLSHSQAT